MATHIVKDAEVYYGPRNITGLSNAVTLNYSADLQDNTVLGNSTRSRISGLVTSDASVNGFWDVDADGDMFSDIGASSEKIFSLLPNGILPEDTAFITKVLASTYNQFATIGEVAPFSLEVQGDGTLIRGQIFMNEAVTADDESTVIELGDVPVGSKIFAVLHVVNAPESDTFNVDLVSNSSGTFGGGETIQGSFTTITTEASSSELISVEGEILDTFWRFEWATTGNGPYTIMGAAGITSFKNN